MNSLFLVSTQMRDRKSFYKRSGNLLLQVIGCLKINHNTINRAVVSLVLLTTLDEGHAAGFAVLEQSVRGLGNAYSGGTAGGEDISTLFYNPAGLSEYTGTEVISGAHFALPEVRFKADESSDSFNRPLTGNDGMNAGNNVLIPNLYLATDLIGPLRFGLGITVPFGLGAQYDKDWQGRYEATDSQLKTIDINPAISYAVNDMVSLGFGISAQYVDVKLSNAIDFGTLCIGQLGIAACSGLGLSPQSADGNVEIEANGWSWGYNAGILLKPVPGVRLGIAYRSRVNYQLKGKARFQVPASAQLLTATNAFRNTGTASESDMPASLSIGAIYESKQKWAMLLNFTWTEWSRLDKLTTHFDNPAQPDSTLGLDFKNTLRASIGFNYHLNPAWTLRSGFAYDESPVPNAKARTFRVPDSDRYWLTVGVSYRRNPNLNFNLAYAHVFMKDGLIEREDPFGHTIRGRFESQIDIISAEFQWAF